MRFIKGIAAVVLILGAVLVLIGVFVPEVDSRIELNVERPVVGVFAGMLDMGGLPDWVRGLEDVERTSGIMAFPGSTFRLKYKEKETGSVYTLEILEMQPLQRVKFRLYNDKIDMLMTVDFAVSGLSTKMDVYVQMKGKDLLARSFIPLMKSVITEEVEKDFVRFKQLQEN